MNYIVLFVLLQLVDPLSHFSIVELQTYRAITICHTSGIKGTLVVVFGRKICHSRIKTYPLSMSWIILATHDHEAMTYIIQSNHVFILFLFFNHLPLMVFFSDLCPLCIFIIFNVNLIKLGITDYKQ